MDAGNAAAFTAQQVAPSKIPALLSTLLQIVARRPTLPRAAAPLLPADALQRATSPRSTRSQSSSARSADKTAQQSSSSAGFVSAVLAPLQATLPAWLGGVGGALKLSPLADAAQLLLLLLLHQSGDEAHELTFRAALRVRSLDLEVPSA